MILKGGEVSDLIAHLTVKAFLSILAVFIFATVQLMRYGIVGDYLVL